MSDIRQRNKAIWLNDGPHPYLNIGIAVYLAADRRIYTGCQNIFTRELNSREWVFYGLDDFYEAMGWPT